MTADQIVASLRAKSPGALAELLDSYGDQLFLYCWCMLGSRAIAQIALRDTLVVAEANIDRLAVPGFLGSWLYALARIECLRRHSAEPYPSAPPEDPWQTDDPSLADAPSLADEPTLADQSWLAGDPSQGDADSRLMAWRAATSMAADEFEALELTCRHEVDLALVLGLSTVDAQVLLDRGKQNLERALGAEILVTRGGQACPDLAQAMSGWTGTMTPQIQASVLEHAGDCPVCDPHLPHNVSAWRVFARLPAPAFSPLARSEVLAFFADNRLSADREFAVDQAATLEEPGLPAEAESPAALPLLKAPRSSPRLRFLRPGPGRILAGGGVVAAAALAAAAIAIAFVLVGPSGKPAGSSGNAAAVPGLTPSQAAGAPSGPVREGPGLNRSPQPVPTGTASGQDQAVINEATKPKASVPTPGAPLSPWLAPSPAAASAGTLNVSPGSISLRAGATAPITLTAVGGPVTWSAAAPTSQVSLSSEGGMLEAGQAVNLEIAVGRDQPAGSVTVSIEPPSSAPHIVEVSWTPPPSPSRSPSQSPSSSPSSSASPSPSSSPSPFPSASPSPSPSSSPSQSSSPSSSPSRSPSPSLGRPSSRSRPRSHPLPRSHPHPRPRSRPRANPLTLFHPGTQSHRRGLRTRRDPGPRR